MIHKIRLVGFLAMLPLLTATAAVSYIEDVGAVGGLGIKEKEERSKSPESPPPAQLSLQQIGEPQVATTSQKSYKGFDKEQYDNTQTFRVVYLVVNEADSDVWNVEILADSDLESVKTELQGKLAPKNSVISVAIKAQDPDSIKAKITGYQTS